MQSDAISSTRFRHLAIVNLHFDFFNNANRCINPIRRKPAQTALLNSLFAAEAYPSASPRLLRLSVESIRHGSCGAVHFGERKVQGWLPPRCELFVEI